MKTQPYFQTIVKAGSIKERDERIADLTCRGFEVARYFEKVDETRHKQSGLTPGRYPTKKQYDGGFSRSTYGAVLRKPNARTD